MKIKTDIQESTTNHSYWTSHRREIQQLQSRTSIKAIGPTNRTDKEGQRNKYLSKFIPPWNQNHSNEPAKSESRITQKCPDKILKVHFASQEKRILIRRYTFLYQNKKYTFVVFSCPQNRGMYSLLFKLSIFLCGFFLMTKYSR